MTLVESLPIIYKDPEVPALPEVSHAALLAEAYDNLTHELDINGNSPRLSDLRKHYFERFLSYWQSQISTYREICRQEGSEGEFIGKVVQIGRNQVHITESLHPRRLRLVLDVWQTGSDEEDHMQIEIKPDGSQDTHFPPTLHSHLTGPDGKRNVTYHFEFQGGSIWQVERWKSHYDPEGLNAAIDDNRSINFSLLNLTANSVAVPNPIQ